MVGGMLPGGWWLVGVAEVKLPDKEIVICRVTGRLCQSITLQDYDEINKGLVNSLMYKHQAEHFTNTQNLAPAIKCLKLGRLRWWWWWW